MSAVPRSHTPLYEATFRNAGELYLYLQDNPKVVNILHDRTWWDHTELNPLHMLLLMDRSSANLCVPLQTAVGMLKALLSFQPYKEALFCQVDKRPLMKFSGDALRLIIISKEDPKQMRAHHIRATPLQIAAFHAENSSCNPLLELLLEHGCNPLAMGMYKSPSYNIDASGFAALNNNYLVGKRISNYANSGFVASSAVVTTLTAKVTEKPKLERILKKQDNLEAQLTDIYEKYSSRQSQMEKNLRTKKKELATLEEELRELKLACAQNVSTLFEQPAFCSEAKKKSVCKELEDLNQLIEAMRKIGGSDAASYSASLPKNNM